VTGTVRKQFFSKQKSASQFFAKFFIFSCPIPTHHLAFQYRSNMAATLQRIHVEGARRRIRGTSPRYLPPALQQIIVAA